MKLSKSVFFFFCEFEMGIWLILLGFASFCFFWWVLLEMLFFCLSDLGFVFCGVMGVQEIALDTVMEFVKVGNSGRFHSAIYHKFLHSIVSLFHHFSGNCGVFL